MILFGLAGLPSLPLPMFSYAFSKMDFLESYSYCAAGFWTKLMGWRKYVWIGLNQRWSDGTSFIRFIDIYRL
jgi:hypothetical protein